MFTRSVAVLGTGTGKNQHQNSWCELPLASYDSIELVPAPQIKMDPYFDQVVSVGDVIELDICGTPFKVRLRLLLKFPQSRLGKLAIVVLKNKGVFSSQPNHKIINVEETVNDLCDVYHVQDDAYYFNRSPYNFEHILGIYRDGQAHFPIGQCASLFHEEMQYWKLSEAIIGPCCMPKYLVVKKYMEPPEETHRKEDQEPAKTEANGSIRSVSKHGCASTKAKTWQFLETPSSSIPAAIFSIISLIFVFATVILLIMSSMPEFQQTIINDKNQTETVIDPHIELADVFCLIFFTAEHAVRLWSAPDRCLYLKTPYCVIDMLAIVPFYFELLMNIIGIESHFSGLTRSFLAIRILRALRIARVLRVLKVARYSKGFQSVGSTFKKCWRESLMLILFMLSTNVVFSTIAYQLEIDNGTKGFESIPAASWWCIITMTTVGYGDIYPKTVAGKLFTAAVCMTGIILLAFPISVIVEHFQQEYRTDPAKIEDNVIDD